SRKIARSSPAIRSDVDEESRSRRGTSTLDRVTIEHAPSRRPEKAAAPRSGETGAAFYPTECPRGRTLRIGFDRPVCRPALSRNRRVLVANLSEQFVEVPPRLLVETETLTRSVQKVPQVAVDLALVHSVGSEMITDFGDPLFEFFRFISNRGEHGEPYVPVQLR